MHSHVSSEESMMRHRRKVIDDSVVRDSLHTRNIGILQQVAMGSLDHHTMPNRQFVGSAEGVWGNADRVLASDMHDASIAQRHNIMIVG